MIKNWNLGYEKSKTKAKIIYNKIGNIQCPIFNSELVSFNSKGFKHLIRRGRTIRTRNERKRRFRLIPYLEQMVKNPTPKTIVEFEEREIIERVNRFGEKIIVKKKAKAWALIQTVENCKIKLIIIQVNGRKKEFFSVMSSDVKLSRPSKNPRKGIL